MSNPPSISSLTLDGVTLQYAGELLFDSSLTTAHRTRFRDTYVKSLSSLAYAILFHDSLMVSGNIATAQSDTTQLPKDLNPGKYVTEQFGTLFYKDDGGVQSTTPNAVSPNPEDLLDDPVHRQDISDYLKYVGKSFVFDPKPWEIFINREAEMFLGEDDSLRKKLSPSEYVFAKPRGYMTNGDLQKLIAEDTNVTSYGNFTGHLANMLADQYSQQKTNKASITKDALQEFVSRVALTHFVIHHWYNIKAGDDVQYRLNHATRANVDILRINDQARQRVQDAQRQGEDVTTAQREYETKISLASFKDIVTLHGLYDAVKNRYVVDRESLRKELINMRTQSTYIELRRMLRELEGLTGVPYNKRKDELDKIHREINRLNGTKGERITEQIKIIFSFVDADTKFRHLVLRNMIMAFPSSKEKHYNSRLEAIFPELRVRQNTLAGVLGSRRNSKRRA